MLFRSDPLYSTVINFAFTATKQKMLETFNYFEAESNGSYYISQLSINKPDNNGEESAKISDESYSVNLTMNLYYFKPTGTVATSST